MLQHEVEISENKEEAEEEEGFNNKYKCNLEYIHRGGDWSWGVGGGCVCYTHTHLKHFILQAL